MTLLAGRTKLSAPIRPFRAWLARGGWHEVFPVPAGRSLGRRILSRVRYEARRRLRTMWNCECVRPQVLQKVCALICGRSTTALSRRSYTSSAQARWLSYLPSSSASSSTPSCVGPPRHVCLTRFFSCASFQSHRRMILAVALVRGPSPQPAKVQRGVL